MFCAGVKRWLPIIGIDGYRKPGSFRCHVDRELIGRLPRWMVLMKYIWLDLLRKKADGLYASSTVGTQPWSAALLLRIM